jgi:hypothetical protein
VAEFCSAQATASFDATSASKTPAVHLTLRLLGNLAQHRATF